jgi:tetratricopeptide (TPR) repeat protein
MSGVVCPDCNAPDKQDPGYFLPQSPSDLSKTAIWECTGCRRTKILSHLFPVEILAEEIAKMFEAAQDQRIGFPELVASCEALMAKYQGKVLHPNHWVIQDAARAMFNLAQRDFGVYSLDIPTHQRFIKLGEYLLETQDKVSPGYSNVRAFLHQTEAFCLSNLATKLMTRGDFQMAIRHIEHGLQFHKKILEYSRGDFPGIDGLKFEMVQENMWRDLYNMQQCEMMINEGIGDHGPTALLKPS